MTVSLSFSPALVLPGVATAVSFATTARGANYVRLGCTNAPRGSELRRQIDDAGAGNVLNVYAGASSEKWFFTPDVGGAYVFTATECRRGATQYGGGYYADADADATEEALGSNTVTVNVASRLESKIGVGADTATLVCIVLGDTIKRTNTIAHGESSPAIVRPSSSRAATAADSIAAELDLIAEYSAETAVGNVEIFASTLAAWFETHRVRVTCHATPDTSNIVTPGFANPTSGQGMAAMLNDLRAKVERHMRNDLAGAGPATADWHSPGGAPRVDMSTGIIAPAASPDNRLSQLALAADIRRVLAAHAVSPAHSAPDTAALSAGPRLARIHSAFLSVIAAHAPESPGNANSGATVLIHNGGFTES